MKNITELDVGDRKWVAKYSEACTVACPRCGAEVGTPCFVSWTRASKIRNNPRPKASTPHLRRTRRAANPAIPLRKKKAPGVDASPRGGALPPAFMSYLNF